VNNSGLALSLSKTNEGIGARVTCQINLVNNDQIRDSPCGSERRLSHQLVASNFATCIPATCIP
jgi:hypothetical protein